MGKKYTMEQRLYLGILKEREYKNKYKLENTILKAFIISKGIDPDVVIKTAPRKVIKP